MGGVGTALLIGAAGAALGAGAVAVGRKLFGSGSRGSESTGATESYDEKSAGVSETYRLQQALSEFREDTRAKSNKFENDIIKESRKAIDVLIADLGPCFRQSVPAFPGCGGRNQGEGIFRLVPSIL